MKIHAEEMSESETAFMLEQGQLGVERMGEQLGPLAGWFKGGLISEGILISLKGLKVS